MIDFVVADWAAWAPGLQEREAWRAWAQAPFPPRGDEMPALPEVPAMQRRRIDRLGRMAVQAAWWCQPPQKHDGVPLVFASRHGDVQRSFELLQQLAKDEAMSPTQFGLSVHNAVAALYSIVRGERGNYLAIAAGRATAEAALVEAAGLLADGAPEVQVVVYDAGLPGAYSAFLDEPDAPHAWSWRLRADGEGTRLSLDWQAADDAVEKTASALPATLVALRFLLSGDAAREHRADGLRWRWRRHG
ncbi:MAG: beta-ketoacyl synthase chain length factor [Thermomonas sp.]|uniref:beta-ketoacyl synthase chain length factor n=1 Tax=Thermomonas sp. TaxID=1971895 RepID=UPI0039E5C9FB